MQLAELTCEPIALEQVGVCPECEGPIFKTRQRPGSGLWLPE